VEQMQFKLQKAKEKYKKEKVDKEHTVIAYQRFLKKLEK
jgi:hypothetical protein